MEELKTISLLSEAKHILYLVDACYGGLTAIGARTIEIQTTPDYIQKITQYKSRQIITAGGRNEKVIEKAEWGHSAFTKNLLSGLRDWMADSDSDGIITVQELGAYLKKKVTIDSNNQQTPKTRNLTTDEGEFVFFQNEITDNRHQNSDVPMSNNGDNIKIDSNQSLKFIKMASLYIGEINNGHGFGGQGGTYLDEGITEIGLTSSFADAYNSNLDYIQSLGLYYRKYFIPFGTLFINCGLDLTLMTILGSLDGESHVNIGYNPSLGFGYIGEKILFNQSIICNIDIGYLLIPNSGITGIAYEELPHGVNLDLTFGLYKRRYSKKTIMLPE